MINMKDLSNNLMMKRKNKNNLPMKSKKDLKLLKRNKLNNQKSN